MTHTPGPWTIQAKARRNGRWIKSRDGQDIAQILLTKDTSEASANARLIASAPALQTQNHALLAVLERMTPDYEHCAPDESGKIEPDRIALIKHARAVIAKAKETR